MCVTKSSPNKVTEETVEALTTVPVNCKLRLQAHFVLTSSPLLRNKMENFLYSTPHHWA
jgi:hypothetical protein